MSPVGTEGYLEPPRGLQKRDLAKEGSPASGRMFSRGAGRAVIAREKTRRFEELVRAARGVLGGRKPV